MLQEETWRFPAAFHPLHRTTLKRMDFRELVREGYDEIAGSYLAAKDTNDPVVLDQLSKLASGSPPDATALDLGCGAGLPATAFLSRLAYVIGVDISPGQIALAEQLVPDATFMVADMTSLEFPSGSFDIVSAIWSIIHVPRDDQPRLLQDIYHWLKPGGKFLATWPLEEWEGEDANWNGWGAPMWWSHFSAEENLRMLKAAGFLMLSEKRLTSGSEQWLWVLAQRPL
jgi:SAM-dependent methyltransferase